MDGEKSAPTEADLERMLFELVRDHFAATKAAPESVPTDAELRQRAAELGLSVPHPDGFDAVRAEWKGQMLRCLEADEPAGDR